MAQSKSVLEMTGADFQRKRLRKMVLVFFLLVALPLATLIFISLDRLNDEAFLQQRFNAQQTSATIGANLARIIEQEESRPSDQYSYLIVTPGIGSLRPNVQVSPLAQNSQPARVPGLIGYFQIGADGLLTSPLLPTSLEERSLASPLSAFERAQRERQLQRIEAGLASGSAGERLRASRSAQSGSVAPGSVVERQSSALQSAAEQPSFADDSSSDYSKRKDSAPKISQEAILSGAQRAGTKSNAALAKQYASKKLEEANVAESDAVSAVARDGLEQRSLGSSLPTGPAELQRSKTSRKEAVNSMALDLGERDIELSDNRKQIASPENAPAAPIAALRPQITSFEAEIDPLQATRLQNGDLVLFRKVWRGEKRIIQGAVIDTQVFLENLLVEGITAGILPSAASALVSYDGTPLIRVLQPEYDIKSGYLLRKSGPVKPVIQHHPKLPPLQETLLYNAPLNEPLSRFEIFFSIVQVPLPPGSSLLVLLGGVLSLVLVVGLALIYRLGSAQINLAQKRSDFVSAVSHELKTPLTAIRMYGEMLKNDWVADEAKKRSYYEYIFQESERLSRLIANVLRFSRLTGTDDGLELHQRLPQSILDQVWEKAKPMVQAAGFELSALNDSELAKSGVEVQVDDDAISQIAINLIDNALKFSKEGQRKEIQVGFRSQAAGGRIVFYVRDFGPGVPKAEQRRIFELFYRSESELTRKTSGTGIGLALVRELAARMHARIDYRSCEPGAEFQVVFEDGHSRLQKSRAI